METLHGGGGRGSGNGGEVFLNFISTLQSSFPGTNGGILLRGALSVSQEEMM